MFGLLPVVLLVQGAMLAYGSMESDLFFEMARRSTCTKPSFHTTYTDLDDFNQQMKEWHNYLRCFHGSGPVTIDSGLKASAQAHAETLASTGGWSHSDRCGVGENIWGGSGETKYPAWKAVRGDATSIFPAYNIKYGNGWYCEEYEKFDFTAGAYVSGAGHFSQVVWRDSTKIGCGISSGGGWTKVVCQYSPGGNDSGAFCWKDGNAFKDLQNSATYSQVCPSTNT